MRRTIEYIYMLVAAVMAITTAACSNDGDMLAGGKVPMTFACSTNALTRADYVAYTGESFGIAAIHHGQSNRPTADVTTYIDNAEVSQQGGTWVTNPIYYWPQGNMHFAAYSPYMRDPATASPVAITLPEQYGDGYFFSGTVDGKTNLMFADEQYGALEQFSANAIGVVPVIFNHALTQVIFRAKMADGTADDIKLTINSLKIKNIFNKGSITFDHHNEVINQWNTENKLWTVDESSSTSYDVVTEATAIAGIGTTATACGNPLYLMPQQLTDNQQLEVTYTIGGNKKTATITLKDVGSSTIKEKWTVNKSVTYTLIMSSGNPVSLVVEVDEWIPLDFTHEFSNTVTINNDGKLRWVEGTYTSINDDKVVMLYDKTQPLKFKFNIAGPLGGTWLAMLITKTGEPDAFELSQTEGAVGQPAEISIRTTGDAVGVSNTAELRFLVRVGTTYLPVDALTTLSGGRNYTIVQNIN